jgi:hypothetical protein
VLQQLHLFTMPTAISISFFDATYFIIAHAFSFSGRDVVLGVVAGAAGGIAVLASVLWHAGRNGIPHFADSR